LQLKGLEFGGALRTEHEQNILYDQNDKPSWMKSQEKCYNLNFIIVTSKSCIYANLLTECHVAFGL